MTFKELNTWLKEAGWTVTLLMPDESGALTEQFPVSGYFGSAEGLGDATKPHCLMLKTEAGITTDCIEFSDASVSEDGLSIMLSDCSARSFLSVTPVKGAKLALGTVGRSHPYYPDMLKNWMKYRANGGKSTFNHFAHGWTLSEKERGMFEQLRFWRQ